MAEYDSRPEIYEHITQVRNLLLDAAVQLIDRAHLHDVSKLLPPEVEAFDEFTPKLKDLVYGSDEYRECLRQMKPALEHHYAANRHHPEHFEGGIGDMNLLDMLEMLCDWIEASKRTKDGDVRKSIETINAERFGYDEGVKRLLLNTLDVLEGMA